MSPESDKIIKELEANAGNVTSDMLRDIIKSDMARSERMQKLWCEYAGDAEIKHRYIQNPLKLNYKLANDFRGVIVDEVVGYVWGVPIEWEFTESNYSETESELIEQTIDTFQMENKISDLDASTATYMTVCGEAGRLLYIDTDGKIAIMNTKPWETIFIYDSTLEELQYAMIYYVVMEQDEWDVNKMNRKYKVEWYDKTNVTFYYGTLDKGFTLDPNVLNPVIPHMFQDVPIVHFKNNDLHMGEFEKVNSLINAYDMLVSNVSNEVGEFSMAYLVAYGVQPNEETLRAARQTGMFAVSDKDGRMEFLTKDLNGDVVEAQKKTLRDNIYLFSGTVDMSDEKFSGAAQSGESRKWKLMALENKSIIKERKFTQALHEQAELIVPIWNSLGVPLNVNDLEFVFTRNLPVEILQSADIVSKLKGVVSQETLLGLLPFISDPAEEMIKIQQESQSVNDSNSSDINSSQIESDATADELDGNMTVEEVDE